MAEKGRLGLGGDIVGKTGAMKLERSCAARDCAVNGAGGPWAMGATEGATYWPSGDTAGVVLFASTATLGAPAGAAAGRPVRGLKLVGGLQHSRHHGMICSIIWHVYKSGSSRTGMK